MKSDVDVDFFQSEFPEVGDLTAIIIKKGFSLEIEIIFETNSRCVVILSNFAYVTRFAFHCNIQLSLRSNLIFSNKLFSLINYSLSFIHVQI